MDFKTLHTINQLVRDVADLRARVAAIEESHTVHYKNYSEPAPVDPREAYKAKFGKAPHHRMKLETIIKALG